MVPEGTEPRLPNAAKQVASLWALHSLQMWDVPPYVLLPWVSENLGWGHRDLPTFCPL